MAGVTMSMRTSILPLLVVNWQIWWVNQTNGRFGARSGTELMFKYSWFKAITLHTGQGFVLVFESGWYVKAFGVVGVIIPNAVGTWVFN